MNSKMDTGELIKMYYSVFISRYSGQMHNAVDKKFILSHSLSICIIGTLRKTRQLCQ